MVKKSEVGIAMRFYGKTRRESIIASDSASVVFWVKAKAGLSFDEQPRPS
jgi:hypothetical protein